MPNQYEKSTLATYGTPQSILDEIDLDQLYDIVTDEHKKRIQSAINGDYRVYPISDGLYSVESLNDGVVKNTYNVNLHSSSGCSCFDYLMRCIGSGMACKHIWRVRLLIRVNALPSSSQDPFSWLISELYKDRKWLRKLDIQSEGLQSQIHEIEKDLTNLGRMNANYKHFMQDRTDILRAAITKDLSVD